MAVGFAIANSIMLEAPEGLIIVDVTETMESGREVFKAFRRITNRPIKAVIYTHNHADHIFGAEVGIQEKFTGKTIFDIPCNILTRLLLSKCSTTLNAVETKLIFSFFK